MVHIFPIFFEDLSCCSQNNLLCANHQGPKGMTLCKFFNLSHIMKVVVEIKTMKYSVMLYSKQYLNSQETVDILARKCNVNITVENIP